MPELPVTTRTVEVRTVSELQAALTPGTRIIVRTSIASDIAINFGHIEIVSDPGVTLARVSLYSGAHHVRFEGGQYRQVSFSPPCSWATGTEVCSADRLVRDVTLDGIRVVGSPDIGIAIRGSRVLLNQVHVEAQTYAVWNGDFGSVGQGGDLVIRNSKFYGTGEESIVRVHDVTNYVATGNLIQSGLTSTGKHTFRVHGTVGNVYAANNRLVNAGSMMGIDDSGDTDRIGNLIFENNEFWTQNPSGFRVQAPPYVTTATIRNNIMHWAYNTCFLCIATPAGWTVENNQLLPYVTAPEVVR